MGKQVHHQGETIDSVILHQEKVDTNVSKANLEIHHAAEYQKKTRNSYACCLFSAIIIVVLIVVYVFLQNMWNRLCRIYDRYSTLRSVEHMYPVFYLYFHSWILKTSIEF